MYKDIITYELAEGISKEQLIKIAKQIVDDWMKTQSGFINGKSIQTTTELILILSIGKQKKMQKKQRKIW